MLRCGSSRSGFSCSVVAVDGSLVEVGAQHSVEKALEEAEARFRALVERGSDLVNVIGDIDPSFSSVQINPIAPLSIGGTYTLFTFSGTRLGSFGGNPSTVSIRGRLGPFDLAVERHVDAGTVIIALTAPQPPPATAGRPPARVSVR